MTPRHRRDRSRRPATPPAEVRTSAGFLSALSASSMPPWALPAALGVLTLVLGVATFDSKLSLSGDNTEFIILARSLAQGHGLAHISMPQPQPATKYPFGFPLMLAPFAWLSPTGWVGMKVLVLVLFTAAMPLMYLLLQPRLGRPGAAATVILCMVIGDSTHSGGPLLLDYAHQVMSEIPYLTFSLLALILLERGLQRPGILGNHALMAGFATAMWAYYIRSVGIVLLGAVLAYLLFQRDWRRALVFAVAAWVCWLPWALRNRALGSGSAYVKQLVMVNPYFPDRGLLNVGGMVARLAANARDYLTSILPHATWPWSAAPHAWTSAPVLLLLTLAAYSTYAALRHGRDLLLWLYTAMYLGTLLLWFWQGDRFLVPILPLLLYFAVRAAMEGAAWAGARGYGTLARAVLVAVWTIWTAAQADGVGRLRQFARGDYPPAMRAWSNYQRAGTWLRTHTDPDAVVMCRKGYWLYVVSSRRCVPYPFAAPDSILAEMNRRRVDYVVVESLGFSQTPRFLVPAINAYRQRFKVVWQRQDPPTFVLRYRARLSAGTSAP